MLSDERTTHEELPAPREVEGLVVAPGRAVMRSLVGFLRGEGINVRNHPYRTYGPRGVRVFREGHWVFMSDRCLSG